MKKFIVKYKWYLISLIIVIVLFFVLKDSVGLYFRKYYNTENIKSWLLSFGQLSFVVFILLQVLQVVLFFIPGEVTQIAGGFIFGTFWGTVLSTLGILIGAAITFLAARAYGDKLLKKILPKKDYENVRALIDKPKNKLIIFLLYLLPAFPKDALGYVSGITPIKLREFLLFSTLARLPGIIVSGYIGSNLYHQKYLLAGIFGIIIVVIFAVCMVKQDKILQYMK